MAPPRYGIGKLFCRAVPKCSLAAYLCVKTLKGNIHLTPEDRVTLSTRLPTSPEWRRARHVVTAAQRGREGEEEISSLTPPLRLKTEVEKRENRKMKSGTGVHFRVLVGV